MAETAPANLQNVRRIDPVTASVIQGALENIAVEMGHKLMRMSYSSIIRESEDFGAALIDPQGRQLCETPAKHAPAIGADPGLRPGYSADIRGTRRRFSNPAT